MDLFINSISNEEVLNSYNFARMSDVVYSEVVSTDQYNNLENNNTHIISKDENYIFYKIDKFNIKENDIVFTSLFMIDSLFEELYKIKNLKNVKLITHQSDESISYKLYKRKPTCISEWYGINVEIQTNNLIPIPIGLSNDHYKKSLTKRNYSSLKKIKLENKIEKLYINFEVNTNFNERYKLLKKFDSNHWVDVETSKLSLDEYISKLNKYKYILCPWGNGVDTHRLWEVLYIESIPVTKYHHTYHSVQDLPVLMFKNYNEVNLERLNTLSQDFKNFESLNLKYWERRITRKKLNNVNENFFINESKEKQKDTIIKYHEELKNIRKIKALRTLERKIKRRIF
tara:strand:+ start:2313 stop:3341 length:1029 start_codon:yes stop_codon:yes gene_type:complete